MDTITAACISNAIGITLLLTLFMSNNSNYSGDKEARGVFHMGYIAVISCLSDVTAYFIDGKKGMFFTILIYIVNSWLFFANILIGFAWVRFISNHIGAKIGKIRKIIYSSLIAIGSVFLILNCFTPLVFSIKDNVYKRECFFWLYIAIAAVFMIDSIFVFFRSNRIVFDQ